MPGADPILVDTARRMFQELCPPETVAAAEAGEWPAPLWRAVEEAGLALAWTSETAGGAGATLADGFAVARIGATAAAPVPVGETLLAGWLLERAGLRAPAGPMSVAPVASGDRIGLDADGTLRGAARKVPFARDAGHLAVIAQRDDGAPAVALVEAGGIETVRGESLAGEARDEVRLDGVRPLDVSGEVSAEVADELLRMGATLRAQQMAGALAGALDQSIGYAGERVAFGRPIAKFQAVQHNLAVLAGEVAAAGAAADAAASAIERLGVGGDATLLAVATAKIRAGEAAGTGAAIAHQVHGAMGFTREYSLQQRTRRLWSWRDEFGPESVWAIRLGRQVAAGGADALWPAVAAL